MKLQPGTTLITHGQLIDGTGAAPLADAAVIITECLDLLLKRNVPMCPGLGFELFSVQRGKDFGISQRVIDGHPENLEAGAESARMVLKAGDTLRCATLCGAKMMGRESEIGTVEKGKLADLLVVDGDVMKDISILENRENLLAVMQGGVVKAVTLTRSVQA